MYAQLAQVASIEGVKDLNFRAEQSKNPGIAPGLRCLYGFCRIAPDLTRAMIE
jgi:hypothetical protein